MIGQQRQRIERAVTDMVDNIDRHFLRKMQNDMHLCAAKCCQDTSCSVESVQNCVDRCSAPLTRAQNYMQHELGEFQERLQRCVMSCNDEVKVKMPAQPTDDEITKYTAQFERCAVGCVDKHVGLIPQMMKTMSAVLAKGPDAIPQKL